MDPKGPTVLLRILHSPPVHQTLLSPNALLPACLQPKFFPFIL